MTCDWLQEHGSPDTDDTRMMTTKVSALISQLRYCRLHRSQLRSAIGMFLKLERCKHHPDMQLHSPTLVYLG